VQLSAAQDDLLTLMAAAIVHEVSMTPTPSLSINRAVNVTCTDCTASTRHTIYTECQPVSSVQSFDHVTHLGYLLGRNLANWLTDFTRTETS